jgi:hypothetical protein
LTVITAAQGLFNLTPPPSSPAGSAGSDFDDLINSLTGSQDSPGNSSGSSVIAPSTQSALLQLQEQGNTPGMKPPTALSGLGGTIDPSQERQFLQQAGVDFAQSMDTDGDGSVTKNEVVDKLHTNGGLPEDLGGQLYDKLNPSGGSISVAQMATSAASVFAPPWLSASGA